jgi:diacylglycerol kinase
LLRRSRYYRRKSVWSTIGGTRYGFRGLWIALWSEGSFRVELAAFVVTCGLGWWRGFSSQHWSLIMMGSVVVFMAELFNTALEMLLRLHHPRAEGAQYSHPDDIPRSELVRDIYDVSAAAVGIPLIFNGLVIIHALIWPTGAIF